MSAECPKCRGKLEVAEYNGPNNSVGFKHNVMLTCNNCGLSGTGIVIDGFHEYKFQLTRNNVTWIQKYDAIGDKWHRDSPEEQPDIPDAIEFLKLYPIIACQLLPYARCILNGEQDGPGETNLACLPPELKMHIINFLSDKKIMIMGKQEPLLLDAERISRLGLFASNKATIGRTRREFLNELGLVDIQAYFPGVRL